MGIVVKKYGGTSVGSPERIKKVAEQIIKAKGKEPQIVVVVSAMGDTTDELIKLAHEITQFPDEREMDMLLSTGEQISCALLSIALISMGCPAVSLTAQQVEILTTNAYTKAKIQKVSTDRILKELDAGKVVVVAGFQGITEDQNITTLGRGGSDTTAVALAAALDADICEIFTDVAGVYTTDPRIVPEARKLELIAYEEMLELASAGAKVLQARSVEMAKKFGVKIHVRSSFNDLPGTIVCEEVANMEDILVSGVTSHLDEAKITVSNVPNKPGMAAKIFSVLSEKNINVDMIVQSASTTGETNNISFTVTNTDLAKSVQIMEEVSNEIGAGGVISDNNVAKVSIVGVGMRSHCGIASKMFSVLASKGINIDMISTSEIKVSCIIKRNQAEEAVKALHEAFDLAKKS
ncbi:MAG: aspartate kinase [Nitrospirota bacterium]